MADEPEIGVDLAVADRLAGFSRLHLGSELQVRPRFQPSAASMTSQVPRVPEPGLPMLRRLPLASVMLLMPEASLAMTVTGSGCTEKTARSFLKAPLSLNFDVPL